MKKSINLIRIAAVFAVLLLSACSEGKYKEAQTLLESGDAAQARAMFVELGNYEDSQTMVKNLDAYNTAQSLLDSGDYQLAINGFTALGGFLDSAQKVININAYYAAQSLLDSGDYQSAIDGFTALGGFLDSAQKVININAYNAAQSSLDSGDYQAALDGFAALGGFQDSGQKATEIQKKLGNLYDLVSKKSVSAKVMGESIDYTQVELTNKEDEEVTVYINVGTWFDSVSSSVQNMLVRSAVTVTLSPKETRTVSVPTACMNIDNDIPDTSNGLIIKYDDDALETKLAEYAAENDVSYDVFQAALWIITDNASDSRLRGSLVNQFGLQIISQDEIDAARDIVEQLK
jgi:tetratricopeptide (TPR) repeat protein